MTENQLGLSAPAIVDEIVKEIRLVVDSQKKPLALDQWLASIATRVEKLKGSIGSRINVGRDLALNLPADCKVTKYGDRMIIEAPAPILEKADPAPKGKGLLKLKRALEIAIDEIVETSNWLRDQEPGGRIVSEKLEDVLAKIGKLRMEAEGS